MNDAIDLDTMSTVSSLPNRMGGGEGGAWPPDDRWRPTRAGLVNLWRYWDETFTFHHGRLLLRGPNGSGKSMALELLLPFLLDGDASPSRLTSAARSRGGLYERVMTGTNDTNRTGFAWVEFRRGADSFTVGVRLRASVATRKVDHDFFTTTLAVGEGLHLLDEQRGPLTRRDLSEAIGATGSVHRSAEEHRAAVRSVLFPGFSADRYDAVIAALLSLRKEKVSQNLDLDKLSAVLSEALPPLHEHDLAEVAEGFERLDRRRGELAALEGELAEVKALAARQRDYARAVMAALSGEVRAAETRRDDVTRTEREAAAALDEVTTEGAAAAAEAVVVEERLAAANTEIEALKDSDAYRDGVALDDLRNDARQRAQLVARDRGTAAGRAADREAADLTLAETAEEHGEATANDQLAGGDLRQAASRLGAEPLAAEALAAGAEEGEGLLRAWVRSRRQLIADVRAALESHRRSLEQRSFEESRLAVDETVVAERLSARRAAESAHLATVGAYTTAVRSWAASCQAAGPDRLAEALPDPPSEPTDVAAAVAGVAAALAAEHAVNRRDLSAARCDLEEERSRLEDERAGLAGGRISEPDEPGWRTSRVERAGAPLWRLVDTAPEVAPGDTDGLEAALTAAGLLDAWVSPDGTVALPASAADVLLAGCEVPGVSGSPSFSPALATLIDFVVPLEDAPVAAAVTARVLTSIPVVPTAAIRLEPETGRGAPFADGGANAPEADGVVAVGLDGTFRLGPAAGRGPLRPAEWLGAEAQERRRRARLAELDDALADCDARLADLDRQVGALKAIEAAVAADLAAIPDAIPLADAIGRLAAAGVRFGEAEDRLAASRQRLTAAEDSVRQALRTLMALAAQHQLPTSAESLADVDAAVGQFEIAAATWVRRRRDLAGTERELRRATRDAEQAAARAAEAAAHLAESERRAAEITTRLAALESSLGAEYQQILDRLSALDGERHRLRGRREELARLRPSLDQRIGTLRAQLEQAEAARLQAEETRLATHRRFTAALGDGLARDGAVAAPAGPFDGVSAVLATARAVAAELDGVAADHQAVERLSNRVEERLHHAHGVLGGRVDLNRELAEGGWWVLRAATSGLRRAALELSAALAGELDAGRAELAADEERLFEQTLAGSVRHALAGRIRLANRLVDGINEQLGVVRSQAGGVAVRLRWEVDAEQHEAVKAARALLLRDPAGLSDAERASLQAFVRARIDQARADLEPTSSWEARLRETLDYRAWHRFTLQLAHRDWDGFQPATPKRLQRLSTGERSIALHLPMLASIAAHYASDDGSPSGCPRLILLDELFAGVDTANRAQLFGTFSDWGLDAVFTSDHEWCQYATLDGIAIHHLHPAMGHEPVTSTRFTWDGSHRVIDDAAA